MLPFFLQQKNGNIQVTCLTLLLYVLQSIFYFSVITKVGCTSVEVVKTLFTRIGNLTLELDFCQEQLELSLNQTDQENEVSVTTEPCFPTFIPCPKCVQPACPNLNSTIETQNVRIQNLSESLTLCQTDQAQMDSKLFNLTVELASAQGHHLKLNFTIENLESNMSGLHESARANYSECQGQIAKVNQSLESTRKLLANCEMKREDQIRIMSVMQDNLTLAIENFSNASLTNFMKYNNLSDRFSHSLTAGRHMNARMTDLNATLIQCLKERDSLTSNQSETVQALQSCQLTISVASVNLTSVKDALELKDQELDQCYQISAQQNETLLDAVNKYLASYSLAKELAGNHSSTLAHLENCQEELIFERSIANDNLTLDHALQKQLDLTENRLESARQALSLCQLMSKLPKIDLFQKVSL